jgi:hypothetical protein
MLLLNLFYVLYYNVSGMINFRLEIFLKISKLENKIPNELIIRLEVVSFYNLQQ